MDTEPGGAAQTDTWLDIILIFLPRQKATFKRFIIEYKDAYDEAKRLRMGLSDEEVDLMRRGNL